MMQKLVQAHPLPLAGLPRLPAPGWSLLAGPYHTDVPCVADAAHRFFTPSGRHAIVLALHCLKVGKQDRVLVPSYHCPSMIAAVLAAGAAPLFYAIDAQGHPILDTFPADELRDVRALLVPHYFGIPQPMAAIRTWCDDHNMALIEDCAHAMFGTCDGRPLGQWGDFAIASIPKFFPSVDGGILVSAQHAVEQLAPKSLSVKAEIKALANFLEIGANHAGFPGLNRLLSGVFALRGGAPSAANQTTGPGPSPKEVRDHWLALNAISPPATRTPSRIGRWVVNHAARQRIVTRRRENYALLSDLLADVPGAHPLRPQLPEGCVPYMFPLWVDQPDTSYHPARQAGVPVFRWNETWPHDAIEQDQGAAWSHHVFQLGCHQDLTADHIHAMAAILRQLFQH